MKKLHAERNSKLQRTMALLVTTVHKQEPTRNNCHWADGAHILLFSLAVVVIVVVRLIDEDHGLPGATARREYLLLDHSILWHRRMDHRFHAAGFHRRISSLVGWCAHFGGGEFLRRRNERIVGFSSADFILLFSHKHQNFCLLFCNDSFASLIGPFTIGIPSPGWSRFRIGGNTPKIHKNSLPEDVVEA